MNQLNSLSVNITAKEISDVHPEAKFVVNTCAPTYFQYFEDLFSNNRNL